MDLESVMVSQAKFLEHDRESYVKFQDVLKRVRLRRIPSSTAAVSVYKFLDHRRYSNVLLALKPFLPNNYTENADFRECFRFLNRLATQYSGVYTNFLDLMNAYSRRELSLSEVCTMVVRLLDKDQELAVEFSSLMPDLKRRRRNHEDDEDQEIHAPPTRKPPKRRRIFTKKEEVDFDMEESLCYFEVQIGQLESAYGIAEELHRRIISGELSPEDARVDKHLSALDLSCIRKIYKQILMNDEMIRCEKLPELMQRLMMKKEILENCRAELKEKWIKIRQSRPRN